MEWLYTLFCRQRSKHRSFLWALHPRQPQYQEGFQPADRTLHGIYRHSLCCHTVIGYVYRKKKPTKSWCKCKKNFRNTRASRCGMGFHIIRIVKYVKILKATPMYFLVRRASEQLNNKSIFFYIYFFILFLIYKLRLFTMRKIGRK